MSEDDGETAFIHTGVTGSRRDLLDNIWEGIFFNKFYGRGIPIKCLIADIIHMFDIQCLSLSLSTILLDIFLKLA
jgi:hypothetical protein